MFILSVPEVSPVSEMLSEFIVIGLFRFVCCFIVNSLCIALADLLSAFKKSSHFSLPSTWDYSLIQLPSI